MTILVLGLVLFLGVHSVRIVAEGWRARTLARVGAGAWKGGYSVLALAGLVLTAWGYGLAREQTHWLWLPPAGMRHLAWLLTWAAFVLITAAYVPHNHLKARLRHPMVTGVALWALGHLLANGSAVAVLLFGAFLLWALLDRWAARRRDRAAAMPALPRGRASGTAITLAVGTLSWALFALWLHGPLIGVAPLAVQG